MSNPKDTREETGVCWYGIRTIYRFGKKGDGTNLFEERICVFSGRSKDEAFGKSTREAEEYAKALSLEWHPVQLAYEQDGDPLLDGYEVWSEVFEHDGDLASFVKSRYDAYEYHPDE